MRIIFILIFIISIPLYLIAQSYQGIGARIEKAKDGSIKISEVFPGSPAQKQGLQEGDLIIEVNGKSTQNMTASQAAENIRGAAGSNVDLNIKGKEIKRLSRQNIQAPPRNFSGFYATKPPSFSQYNMHQATLSLRLKDTKIEKEHYLFTITLDLEAQRKLQINKARIFLQFPAGTKIIQSTSFLSAIKFQSDQNHLLISHATPYTIENKQDLTDIQFTVPLHTEDLTVDFLFNDKKHTIIQDQEGKDLLGSSEDPGDGAISYRKSMQSIFPAKRLPALNKTVEAEIIIKGKQHISVNEEVKLEVHLKPNDTLFFQKLNMELSVKGNNIKFIDEDQNNHIRFGLNVHDGDAHKRYPFSEHYANKIQPSTGKIRYKSGSRKTLQPNGSCFEIHFIPEEPGQIQIQILPNSYLKNNRSKYTIKPYIFTMEVEKGDING